MFSMKMYPVDTVEHCSVTSLRDLSLRCVQYILCCGYWSIRTKHETRPKSRPAYEGLKKFHLLKYSNTVFTYIKTFSSQTVTPTTLYYIPNGESQQKHVVHRSMFIYCAKNIHKKLLASCGEADVLDSCELSGGIDSDSCVNILQQNRDSGFV